nr:hypothetical protein [uncultured Cellulosilyticum sp.]
MGVCDGCRRQNAESVIEALECTDCKRAYNEVNGKEKIELDDLYSPKGCCVICEYSEGVWDEEKVGCEIHGGMHNNDDVCTQFKEIGAV